MTFFAAVLLMVDFTTTYTTTTTFMRSALDNDALRRVVAVAIRRARCVRRGYIKSSEAAKKTLELLFTARNYRTPFRRFTSRIWRSQMNRRAVASSRLLKTIGRSPIQNGVKLEPIAPAFQGLGVLNLRKPFTINNKFEHPKMCIIGSLQSRVAWF